MQILLVVGLGWSGIAARQGSTHPVFWLLGVLLLFLPVAAVIQFCVKIWPLEGGVYQWTKHVLGPFAGFISAWNFGVWALLNVSTLGIEVAASLGYALGPEGSWMPENRALTMSLNVALFSAILLVNIRGFGIGRWVAHFGTATTLMVTAVMVTLLFIHPQENALHPHISPQPPFSLSLPLLTMTSLNLFTKLTFSGFSGLEQVAVFAGETRDAARTILRSAWIAAPAIALLYILVTSAMLTYTPAHDIDLTGPVPQALAAAFGASRPQMGTLEWGAIFARCAILALALAHIAQDAIVIAESSRLPMVAAWDHLIPSWFTKRHVRYGTPVRSLIVIALLAILCSCFASAGSGAQEAYQLLILGGNTCYAVYYVLMFAVPLIAGTHLGLRPDLRPGGMLRIACLCGITITVIATGFNLVPIVTVSSTWVFALKVVVTAITVNVVGTAIYFRGVYRSSTNLRHQ